MESSPPNNAKKSAPMHIQQVVHHLAIVEKQDFWSTVRRYYCLFKLAHKIGDWKPLESGSKSIGVGVKTLVCDQYIAAQFADDKE